MNIACKRKPIWVMLGALGLAAAMTARPTRADDAHKTVSVADLDLSTAEGMQAAQTRLGKMAKKLCARMEDPDDLSHHENFLACVDQSMANVMRQLRPMALAAVEKTRGSTIR